MKKIAIIALAAAAAALGFSSCQKNEIAPEVKAEGNFKIYAGITKTTIDGYATKWAAGDSINVFHAEAGTTSDYGANNKFIISEEGLATGVFTGTLSGALAASNDWYALYPYESHITTPANPTKGYIYIGCNNSYKTAEIQTGNNSTAHLAGQNFPLYAKAGGIAKDDGVSLNFKPILSIVKFQVTNKTSKAITVTSASLTANEDIIGSYYIDFSGDNAILTASGATFASKTANLTVNAGAEIAPEASADFYMAIKPFTNNEGSTLTFSVNGYEKTSTAATTFASGKVTTIKFSYDKKNYLSVDPTEASVAVTAGATTINVSSDQTWTVSSDNSEFTVSPASGTGDGTVNVTYNENTAFTSRTANITFSVAGESRATTVITQAAAQDPSATTAELTNAEILAEVQTGTGYGTSTVTITSTSGEWTGNMNHNASISYIQIRNKQGSFLQTPLFTKDIEKMEFTIVGGMNINTKTGESLSRQIYAIPVGTELPTTSSAYSESLYSTNYGFADTSGQSADFTATLTVSGSQKQLLLIGKEGANYIKSVKVYFK